MAVPASCRPAGSPPASSEFNNGLGNTVVNLGNIAQGSVATAIEELINNAPAGGTFAFSSPDGAFTLTQGAGSATLGVDTSMLGSHTALLSYTSGSVHDTLTISDRVLSPV